MWTKAEVAKLTVEQQEVLARFELSKARQRDQLLKEARGRDERGDRRYLLATALAVIFFITFLMVFKSASNGVRMYFLYALCGLQIINVVIQMHTARINRRLDALLKLLDLDYKDQADRNSKDEKIG
jgi:archaellum biogenesis protein FlaJ (TadC family)